MASSSSAPIRLNLVDSSDDDDDNESDDSDFQASEDEESSSSLRQTTMDEYTLKRSAPVDLLVDTFLASFDVTPADKDGNFRILTDMKRPYNYMNLRVGLVPLQIWQATLREINLKEVAFAKIIDLGMDHSKQNTSPELWDNVQQLRLLGWSNSSKAKAMLDATRATSAAKRMDMARALQKTIQCLCSILEACVAKDANAATEERPSVMIIACDAGLERSLMLFNLLAYAVALYQEARHGEHVTLNALCQSVANRFALRHERVDTDGNQARILNTEIHAVIDNLPSLIALLLPTTIVSTEKKRRYEGRRPRGFDLYF